MGVLPCGLYISGKIVWLELVINQPFELRVGLESLEYRYSFKQKDSND